MNITVKVFGKKPIVKSFVKNDFLKEALSYLRAGDEILLQYEVIIEADKKELREVQVKIDRRVIDTINNKVVLICQEPKW